jgi:hypothetical protein
MIDAITIFIVLRDILVFFRMPWLATCTSSNGVFSAHGACLHENLPFAHLLYCKFHILVIMTFPLCIEGRIEWCSRWFEGSARFDRMDLFRMRFYLILAIDTSIVVIGRPAAAFTATIYPLSAFRTSTQPLELSASIQSQYWLTDEHITMIDASPMYCKGCAWEGWTSIVFAGMFHLSTKC